MTLHIAHREVDVMDGKVRLASFEVRYSFTVAKGIPARTWTNAADGFHPAEDPSVTITAVEVRWHPKHDWQAATGQSFDMLTAEVPDAWFLAQIAADEVAA